MTNYRKERQAKKHAQKLGKGHPTPKRKKQRKKGQDPQLNDQSGNG